MIKTEKETKLKKIENDKLESFYRYQWFHCNVQYSSMEWDTLVVLPEFKLIMNIEVKSGQLPALKKASKQTVDHLKFFKKMFGAVLSKEWKFLKGACTPNLKVENGDSPCEYCRQYVISANDIADMEVWINKTINNHEKFEKEKYETEFKDLLAGLLGYQCMVNASVTNKLIVDPLVLSENTEEKLIAKKIGIDGENEINSNKLKEALEKTEDKYEYLCYMLTPEQINAIKDTSALLFIEGDFGTGKTYILKEKAKMYAKECKQVAYINLTTLIGPEGPKNNYKRYGVMDLIAKNDFKDFNNIDVVTTKDLYDNYTEDDFKTREGYFIVHDIVEHFLKKHEYDHVLIDELPESPINSK